MHTQKCMQSTSVVHHDSLQLHHHILLSENSIRWFLFTLITSCLLLTSHMHRNECSILNTRSHGQRTTFTLCNLLGNHYSVITACKYTLNVFPSIPLSNRFNYVVSLLKASAYIELKVRLCSWHLPFPHNI